MAIQCVEKNEIVYGISIKDFINFDQVTKPRRQLRGGINSSAA